MEAGWGFSRKLVSRLLGTISLLIAVGLGSRSRCVQVGVVLLIGCCSRWVFTSEGSVLSLFVMAQVLLKGPLVNKNASLVFEPLSDKAAATDISFYY